MDTVISIAHEICQQNGAKCVICGKPYDEIHHYPKRKKRGGAPGILYITLWPLDKECHAKDPNLIDNKVSRKYLPTVDELEIAKEHVRRCVARNVYARGDK